MIANGDLGKIRIIQMQFAHGAHNVAVEKKYGATAWRVDPKKAGPAYVLGDVGTHMVYLAEAVLPELKIKRLMCKKESFVEGRTLEDNAMTIMEYDSLGRVGELSAKKLQSLGTPNTRINLPIKFKARLREFCNAVRAIFTNLRGRKTESAADTLKDFSRRGAIFTRALQRQLICAKKASR